MSGRRAGASDGARRNFWPLAIPVFGEACHNNHHAFPGSARPGLHWKQIYLSGALIYGMEKVGLVWDVKVPTEERQEIRRSKGQT